MFAVLAGVALVIIAVVLWLGDISTAHALAIFIGLIGVAMIVWWAAPGFYARRSPPA